MHELQLHMPLYLNISWLEIYCTAAEKNLAYFIYKGLQAEFGIENYSQVMDLFWERDFLAIETDAKLGEWTGFHISGHK